jgi:NAD(P)-dependent dehydrogenase (short-subunit alcohol dehydrogenase family)
MEVVVITGGTAGVGRATARRFARDGAKIAVLARGQDGLDAVSRELSSLGARAALAIPCDVADAEAVFAAAALVERELGPIDIWINNAMTTVFGELRDITPLEYRRVTDVTYLGFVWGTRAALDRMMSRDRGVVVQVGSALAYRSIPLQSAYCGAKHAIAGFTDSVRSELLHARSKVRISMVHAPAINTPQFDWCENHMGFEAQPVPPIFQPEVIADAIWVAARHPRREIYLGWPTVMAIAAQRLVPGIADRYLASHGYTAQHTDERHDPARPSNLFAPVSGDHGAHGRFDDHAIAKSFVARATSWLGAAGVTAVAGAALAAVTVGVAWLVEHVVGDAIG